MPSPPPRPLWNRPSVPWPKSSRPTRAKRRLSPALPSPVGSQPTRRSRPQGNLHRRLCWGAALALLSLGTGDLARATVVRSTSSDGGMVASAHPLATAAGVAMLRQGGNAVDGAVATALAIAVVEPFSAGLGGGGFALWHDQATGSVTALDFRERAPAAASRDMYLDPMGQPQPQRSRHGHLAVGVPGTVAGLYALHERYGQLPWARVLQPSVVFAAQGFVVSDRLAGAIARSAERLGQNPAAAAIFLPDGHPLRVGDILKQPDLAATLQRIAADPQEFYHGETAAAIAQEMATQGGLITAADLEAYQPIWREPLCGPFLEYEVCSMPPPSSGGVHLLQMLNLLTASGLTATSDEAPWHHPADLHRLAEIMKIAYADRAEHLGDPDFVEVPVAALVSPAYAAARQAEIDPQRARPANEVEAADAETLARYHRRQESQDTTHLTVVDGDRNALSLTYTINGPFGAGVVAAGTGILLNNEMDDFAIAPGQPNLYGLIGGNANAVAPGKTPLSSMTPTIVRQGGALRLATGSPGGSTIITTVLQILLNSLVYGLDAGSAVSAPRLHHQWLPDSLMLERYGFDALTTESLAMLGHELRIRDGWGNANLIVVTPNGQLQGAADPRGEGTAQGIPSQR